MANKFVWSGAGGSDDGSNWQNAYTSLMRDWGAEAGFTPATDYIYVRSVHSETSGSNVTIKGSTAEGSTAACRVICCVGAATGTDPGALATGADVNTNVSTANIKIEESLYIYGVDFLSNNDMDVVLTGVDSDVHLEKCRLELTGTSSADIINFGTGGSPYAIKIRLTDVDLDFAASGQGIQLAGCDLEWVGGSVDYDVNVLINSPAWYFGNVVLRGLDLSTLSSSSLIYGDTLVSSPRLIKFVRCLLATGATIVTETIDCPGYRVEAWHCQIGTDADPAYQMEINDMRGKIVTDTTRYRTGGGKDDERTNPISWDFDTTVGSVRGYPGHALESPAIMAWTPGNGSTAHTYRVAFASDATIDDDELWIEVTGPNDAATNSMAVLNTSRVAPRTTASALSTDSSSSWTGTGVGTKQYAEVTYTPDKPGPIEVRIFVAKASDHIYVDPHVQVDP
jgi:hypothetical protein